jgi:hypothetical protein
MGYVLAAILVLLIVAGFVTFVVMSSMRKGAAGDRGGGPPGIGPDPTPLGDTSEHADEQGVDPAAAPAAPDRPEDRQRGDAGTQPESERLADRPR